MAKKIIFMLCGFLLLTGSLVFANDSFADNPQPKNMVTVDTDPFLLLFTSMSQLIFDELTYAFGFGIQYERQLTESLSIGSRFGYGMLRLSDDGSLNMSSFSLCGNVNYFLRQNMFIGANLGYANIFFNNRMEDSIAHHFRIGGRLGWRINFGSPTGFVFVPSIGYILSFGTNLDFGYDDDEFLGGILDMLYDFIARALFLSGPRFSLAFGWRF